MKPEPRPRAGIAVCLLHPDPRRDIFRGKALQFIEERIARALWDAGLIPLALPEVGAGSEGVLLDQVDGLVLMGGADVSPASYGEEGIESNRWPGDRARDLYEIRLVEEASRRNLPILGICRGCQIMNVAFGGSLYQDIATQLPGSLTHRDPERYDTLEHEVDVVPGTWLSRVYGKPRLLTNTIHHQGLKSVAPGFQPNSRAPDGVVEGIERVDRKTFQVGIQWHPEFTVPGGPGEYGESGKRREDGLAIFRAFRDVCAPRSGKEGSRP